MTPQLGLLADAQVPREVTVETVDLRAASSLSALVEQMDGATHVHCVRMATYCFRLGHAIGLSAERCDLLRVAAPLHDIGKLAVPVEILQKPGPLTAAERKVMQTHAEIGHRMLDDRGYPLLDLAASMALTHHERIDGRGYPQAITGRGIPIEGRIAAVADVFDALLSDRPYRKAYPLEDALDLMHTLAGAHLDPELVAILAEVVPVALVRPD